MQEIIVMGIIKNNDYVLIVKRKVKEGTLSWQFPGGKVENGETEQDAVIREVKEETNLKISVSHKIGDRIHPITKKYISYWLCDYISGEIFVDDEDIGEAKWVDGRDVMDYFTTPLFEPVQKILFGK